MSGLVSWICPGQRSDMFDGFCLSGFQKIWPDMSGKGADMSSHIGQN
jgi:hypothetical protein